LKLQPVRVSQLCLRSAYLHLGNALSALDRNAEAREIYEKVLPMLANEPRCGRLDWERSSIIVNIGNTYSREGNYDRANDYYDQAEKLGQDHLDVENGNQIDGMGIKVVAMRARSFALKKAGKDDEAKTRLREVLELQIKLNALEQQRKEKEQLETIQAEQLNGQPVEVA
jgi:tetratricopeptide (TPR) repeat protein